MLDSILSTFRKNSAFTRLSQVIEKSESADIHGLGGSSPAFFLASLLVSEGEKPRRRILAVCPGDEAAESLRDDIEAIAGSQSVHYFPPRDSNPYEHEDSHYEVRSQRVEAIDKLASGWNGIIVASASALHDPTSPPGYVEAVALTLKRGDEVEFDFVVKSFINKGFKRRNSVVSAGQIAVRGGIIDIFPFGVEQPYRLEFWDDEIESIRTFSTSTQRSIDQVDVLRIIPPDEFITEAGLGSEERERLRSIELACDTDLDFIIDAFEQGDRRNGIEQYLFTVHGERASLAEHCSSSDISVVIDPDFCCAELRKKIKHASMQHERLAQDGDILPSVEYIYAEADSFFDNLGKTKMIRVHSLKPNSDCIEFGVSSSRQYQGGLDELKKDIETFAAEGVESFVLCDNSGQKERLQELLDDLVVPVRFDVAHLSGGMSDKNAGLALFTDHEIFSRYRRRIRYRKYKDGVPVPDHRALTLGDFVVHVDYGVGRFMGIKRDCIGGVVNDFLVIDYKGDDQLLLPTGKLDKLKKFSAEEGVVPVVNKLGGSAWEKLKARTKKSIQKIADDLLKLYAERKNMKGFAFNNGDPHMLEAMIDSFVYEETVDQVTSWCDVFEDMKSESPMERLICGDVGFGKTEVAMRAAFLSVLHDRQVAVLVPTTILAEQHEKTFRERFADFPVVIESLSRFRTQKEQHAILGRCASGEIDVVIGTHRILSKDFHLKRMGLLIIDEEQRFGVRHKERLKAIRKHVDVLAMSATPIPRTLNLSLMGARDISYINTPPQDRYSVHTEIAPFEEKYLVEAVLREIDRDGQVFFVHNRVKSIDSMAAYLRRLMPSVTFDVAHGQLPEKKLAGIMKRFANREFQVLVSSMIIENGLDMPSVNTIIVNRADTFGLSQLYQLRGRVGRSSRRAFAYMLIPPKTTLTKIALQRLKTIEEFSGLGSGFNIAMRDMEIRGAGNILGTDQSGFIATIGFDMYVELLNETISEMRGISLERPPEVEIHADKDAYLPDDYIPDSTDRLVFYRRLAETLKPEDVSTIVEELVDRYGRLPAEVHNLVNITFLRHFAAAYDVTDLWVRGGKVSMFIPEGVVLNRKKVESMVQKSPVKLTFSFEKGVMINFDVNESDSDTLTAAKNVLQAMCI